jgi:hypothetical protein
MAGDPAVGAAHHFPDRGWEPRRPRPLRPAPTGQQTAAIRTMGLPAAAGLKRLRLRLPAVWGVGQRKTAGERLRSI